MPPSGIDKQNHEFWNELCGTILARERFLNDLGRVMGVDLYITGHKQGN